MKEDILKGLKRALPTVLFLDIFLGVGPINWTLKGYQSARLKLHEMKFKKELKEGEIATIFFNEKGTKGYVYMKEGNRLVKSYFNENIDKPDWYLKRKES